MDDLALLAEMADRTPLPAAADLAPARAKLMTATTRPKRRLLVFSAAAVGLAAAITGVLVLAPAEEPPATPTDAVTVLRLAADATRALPDTPPRPDQLVYTKTKQGRGDIRETWLSTDGTRDGRIEQFGGGWPVAGCRDGQAQVIKGDEPLPGVTEPCTPLPAYQPDLPTTGAAMADYLRARNDGNLNSLGKDIHGLVAESYVQPAALAAVFEAVAQIDGLTVIDGVTDAAGRPGVGVQWTFDGHAHTLVFDARSHMFLGMADTSAVVSQGFVDEVGERP